MSLEINTDDFWKEIDKRAMTHKEEIALLRSELATIKAENESLKRDAERYRMLRRGQRWSVVNGIGDYIRADELDAAIDATMTQGDKP